MEQQAQPHAPTPLNAQNILTAFVYSQVPPALRSQSTDDGSVDVAPVLTPHAAMALLGHAIMLLTEFRLVGFTEKLNDGLDDWVVDVGESIHLCRFASTTNSQCIRINADGIGSSNIAGVAAA